MYLLALIILCRFLGEGVVSVTVSVVVVVVVEDVVDGVVDGVVMAVVEASSSFVSQRSHNDLLRDLKDFLVQLILH